LIVGIGVHNYIGAELQTRFDTRHETRRKPLVSWKIHYVVDATRPSNLQCRVFASIIDYQPLYSIESLHFSWQLPKS